MSTLVDQQARDRAIDVQQSFIVQAPAGSGKTELLSNRILNLLAHAQQPEEIVAITFTRKAAAEMRLRVLARLQLAADVQAGARAAPDSDNARHTLALAQAALARDAAQGWQLLLQPDRLRILTFDSLCSSLARQLPVLSRLGTAADIEEDASALYETAAERTLALLEDDDFHATLSAFLLHFDNDSGKALRLLAEMLGKRDQWQERLGDLRDGDLAARLTADLQAITADLLAAAARCITPAMQNSIMAAARFAADHLRQENPAARIVALLDWQTPLGQNADALIQWQALADLLLTNSDEWRKLLNKNCGFPAGKAEPGASLKAQLQNIVQGYAETALDPSALADVRRLPAPSAVVAGAPFLNTLAQVLSLALAQLWLVFSERNSVDFIAIGDAARAALGSEDEPTDLGLLLDYRIRHLLVDECQDSSFGQMELLRRLTAGWQDGDGRTLFMVGDPMQSIYRFRKAEVALFLHARQHGVGQVHMTPLLLQTNFRSQQNLVDWVNAQGRHLLAADEDAVRGAVPYSAAVAHHPALPAPAVVCQAFAAGDTAAQAEAAFIADAIEQHLPTAQSIAVLGRARAHLIAIAGELRARGIAIEAVDTEPLAGHALVRDLLQLTRALLHPADRLAWLCVLRAPWCGLALQDLHALFSAQRKRSASDLLRAAAAGQFAHCSADAQQRLQRVWPLLDAALSMRARLPLRALVSHCWLQLGGAALLRDDDERQVAEQFFALLETLPADSDDALADLDRELAKLYAKPASGAKVKLMTMHKSKGLEFDVVFLPQLSAASRGDTTPLLRWSQLPAQGRDCLMVAGLRHARADDEDDTGRFLKTLEQERGRHESRRLLYVALTRARQHLYLSATVDTEKTDWAPSANTLLAGIWPGTRAAFLASLPAADAASVQHDESYSEPDSGPVSDPASASYSEQPAARPLQRIGSDFVPLRAADVQAISAPLVADRLSEAPAEQPAVAQILAGDTSRAIGTLAHRWLETFARDPAHWLAQDVGAIDALAPLISKQLRWLDVPETALAAAVGDVQAALRAALQDPRARWLLGTHPEAACEWALVEQVEGQIRQHIIDRTFVDDDGTRWIVDYKTARPEHENVEAFLAARIAEYRPQLQRYARVLSQHEQRPIRLALYFPLQNHFVDWRHEAE